MKFFLVLAFSFFIFVGCASKEKNVQIHEYFPTFILKSNVPSLKSGSKLAKIKNTVTQKMYLGNEMWYKKANEISSFAYSRWIISPNLLVKRVLDESAEKSGVFKSVISDLSEVKSDYLIESTLIDYYQDFSYGKSVSVVTLKVVIVDSNNNLVASKKFSYIEPCKTENAQGGIDAFGVILTKFSNDVDLWLRSNVK
jgi:ABC-type uncharacterized transport system auxiliary subunit